MTYGFTLIELLIVIAIMGILTAILAPNLLNARGEAIAAGADAYARNCLTQVTNYALDHPGVSLANKDCENDLGASQKPPYLTVARMTGDGAFIEYTFNRAGTPVTQRLAVGLD